MPLPGYPDYARVGLNSGYLLAGGQQAFSASTILFTGYVGLWQFINSFWNSVGGTDVYQVEIDYFTDNTFSTVVAVQTSTRGTVTQATKQYAVMTPWARIKVNPKTGGSANQVVFAFYGATQPASAGKLGSCDVNITGTDGSIAATTQIVLTPFFTIPGRMHVSIRVSVSTLWNVTLQQWDFGSAAWQNFAYFEQTKNGAGAEADMNHPDTYIQVLVHNSNTTAQTFNVHLLAENQ